MEGLSVSTPGWDAEQGPYSGNGMLSECRREETGPLSRDGMLSQFPVPAQNAEQGPGARCWLQDRMLSWVWQAAWSGY